MNISNKNITELMMYVNGIDVRTSNNLLGVTIDESFSSCDHISTMCKMASRKISIVMRFIAGKNVQQSLRLCGNQL